MKSIFEKLNSVEARVEQVIWLAAMLGPIDARVAEPLDKLLSEDIEQVQAVFPDLPPAVAEELEWSLGQEADDAFREWAVEAGRLGFLIQIATPVLTWLDDGHPESFSWSCYRTGWVYGDTLDEALAKGLEFVASRRAAEQAKASDIAISEAVHGA
ncbi:hypothetical protein CKO44_07725 [Rubrivivax gelatinosus]|uniref:hypothetical protein n=1 Tax=Rubrivivax gelatinosus TaxID=28068 RepID=UPI00190819AB|nr:hypothetical protein [Rubrivivax gelatinosus]MBK1613358.1 hypothetical protein [Rubrivivax gelatinosus]MBZ8143393.1 hypothetical protein [Rubrivivax gelatinosus]